MCYSAQIVQEYERYVRAWDAKIDLQTFVRLYRERQRNAAIRIPKAMDAQWMKVEGPEAAGIRTLIEEHDRQQAVILERMLFSQRKRLVDAERVLQSRTTRAATESRRIATDKIAWARGKLDDLHRTAVEERDSRIFPGHYAPVMVWEDGRRLIKPMRYQCRPAGKPAAHDRKYPGTYNARRDNLEGFWSGQFGHSHAVVLTSAFYENVSRHRTEGRELAPGEEEQNLVLEFRPQPQQEMLVACLWSHWKSGSEELMSFAAITDDPPPEVAAAGHDRCVVPIKPENLDRWLDPSGSSVQNLHAILEDRQRPYYEHRLAA
ncbi:MAG: SOS response-associated peptidase [Pseudomonadota bacterium]|nr:SOS response-associated peptidase [Pseudomonadota bacterium]